MKAWYRSKTLWVNALAIPVAYWVQETPLVSVHPTWLLVGVSVINLALRCVTTTGVQR